MDKHQYICVWTEHSVCSELCPGEEGHGAETRCRQEEGDASISSLSLPLCSRSGKSFALSRFQDISYDDSIMDFSADAANGIAMEGYLYKRASNAFKTWSRCPFYRFSMLPNASSHPSFLSQALVFHSEKPAGVPEEVQGIFLNVTNKWKERGVICLFVCFPSQEQPTVVVEDLRLCTVKNSTENERRFCFEVVSPSK